MFESDFVKPAVKTGGKAGSLWDYIIYLNPIISLIIICLIASLIFIGLDFNDPQWRSLWILIVMVASWVFNYIDIVVVSFYPLILGAFFLITSVSDIMDQYMTTTTLLYSTASMIGGAFRLHGLDKRFALYMMNGSTHQMFDIAWRFTVIAGFISMWISDTAAMTLLIPILQRMLEMIEDWKYRMELDGVKDPRVFKPPQSSMNAVEVKSTTHLILSYSTAWGGFATLIGATTNFAFIGQFERQFGANTTSLTFATWFFYGFPLSIIHYILTWFCAVLSWEGPTYTFKLMKYLIQSFIYFIIRKNPNKNIPGVKEYLKGAKDALEKSDAWSFAEIILAGVFPLIIIMLFLRDPGIGGFGGWDSLFGQGGFTHDSMVATIFAVILFLLPAHSIKEINKAIKKNPENAVKIKKQMLKRRILNWKDASHAVEWGIIWIFGCGFALAHFFDMTGLTSTISRLIQTAFSDFSQTMVLFLTCIVSSVLTEFISVTNVVSIMTPVLNDVAICLGYNPLLLSYNAVFCCQAGLLLPISTTMNVLAYKAADITVYQMVRTALLFKLVQAITVFLYAISYGDYLFNFSVFPDWAQDYIDVHGLDSCL